ncbi:MAG: tRNA (N6-threonylcarbamoyladenosine(37)-N6)-methyltransferase TrmO [Salinivirgaceae bacterium]|jgi:tRNA-Thr(GGU) m(6)t(6)A37 methyltransferase TsaA|nr:tRNA (N6-threonylcarbamoyladenosine(37)-N6)-methyltransferase TrmO [Salinivirgaceae bacterium]
MHLNTIEIKPIGKIFTPHYTIQSIPIQPIAAEGVKGHIELLPKYVDGLKDIEGFSHIILIYYFHKIRGFELQVTPFMDTVKHGIFATRSPKRPNAMGISTVRLNSVDANILHIEDVDMLNGTPLIDIKPFFSKFDNRIDAKAGWLDARGDIPVERMISDKRFKQ